MEHQEDETAMQALNEVHFVLETTFRVFGTNWERYEDDFEDVGAKHTGRTEKYSVQQIIGEHESETFAIALKDTLEEFVANSILGKIHASGNAEKVLILVTQLFSYLRKTSDWFNDIFSDFETVYWPFDDIWSYSEGCRRVLHEAVYSGIRTKIRDNYISHCIELRRRYSYSSKEFFVCFHNQHIVPLFDYINEWEDEDDSVFWWEPLHTDLTKTVYDKMKEKKCNERTFVVLAKYCTQIERLMLRDIPDDEEQSNFKRLKRKLDDVICKLYWERSDCTFIGLFSKNRFDKFLFEQLLRLLICSPKQSDVLMMHLRAKLRTHLEFKAITLVDIVPNKPLTLEELNPLLTELDETKAFLWERLKEVRAKFPCLAMFEGEVSKNYREQLELYRIDDALALTEGILVNRLKEPLELDSAFWDEAKRIALFIKHLACREEFMNELETFAESNIARHHQGMLSTLAAFVSRYRSVCSIALFTILDKAKLIQNE